MIARKLSHLGKFGEGLGVLFLSIVFHNKATDLGSAPLKA